MSDESTAIQQQMQEEDLWYAPREMIKAKPAILKRRRKVAEHWNMKGLTVAQSADILGVSPSTISQDRRALLDMWQTVVEADVIEIVARELHKLEMQEAELWDAWQMSKMATEDDSREWNEKANGTQAGVTTIRERRISRVPEAKYMDLILKCQERRAKLLGLDKAVTFEAASFSFAMFVEESYDAASTIRRHKDVPLGPVMDVPAEPPKELKPKEPMSIPESTDIPRGEDVT